MALSTLYSSWTANRRARHFMLWVIESVVLSPRFPPLHPLSLLPPTLDLLEPWFHSTNKSLHIHAISACSSLQISPRLVAPWLRINRLWCHCYRPTQLSTDSNHIYMIDIHVYRYLYINPYITSLITAVFCPRNDGYRDNWSSQRARSLRHCHFWAVSSPISHDSSTVKSILRTFTPFR